MSYNTFQPYYTPVYLKMLTTNIHLSSFNSGTCGSVKTGSDYEEPRLGMICVQTKDIQKTTSALKPLVGRRRNLKAQ